MGILQIGGFNNIIEAMNAPCVVITGRPNVGKSSLFNRILKKRVAVVADKEGVTRDLHFQETEWEGCRFQLVDTGGYMSGKLDKIEQAVCLRISNAVAGASAVIFVADGLSGLTDEDTRLAKIVLRAGVPVVLAVNKLEREKERINLHNFWRLGLGEPMAVSAKTKYGVSSLMTQVVQKFPEHPDVNENPKGLRLAILGRPNSGKSTLVNQIMGNEELIVSQVAGTTRDAIDSHFTYKDIPVILTDTAGLRKKARVSEDVEYYCNLRTIESIRNSDVCVLLIDSTRGLESQDLKIFSLVQEAGKGLVLCFNKWDAVEAEDKTFDHLTKNCQKKVPDFEWIPIISLSGLTGKRVTRLLDTAFDVFKNNFRILGRDNVVEFYRETVGKYPHPFSTKGDVKLSRCCQVMLNPVALAFEARRPENVQESYVRYLRRSAYKYFQLDGVALKIFFRRNFKLRTDEELNEIRDLTMASFPLLDERPNNE